MGNFSVHHPSQKPEATAIYNKKIKQLEYITLSDNQLLIPTGEITRLGL